MDTSKVDKELTYFEQRNLYQIEDHQEKEYQIEV